MFNCECAPKDELSVTISSLALGKKLQKEVLTNDSVLSNYIGTYSLLSNPQRTIAIVKEEDHLAANISGQGAFQLIFQSDTKFELKGVLGAKGEFVVENGKVIKFTIMQNGLFEWKKIR
ncbi:MAG: hypothetical protein ACHQD7_00475 [Chitinophagales bacterium]